MKYQLLTCNYVNIKPIRIFGVLVYRPLSVEIHMTRGLRNTKPLLTKFGFEVLKLHDPPMYFTVVKSADFLCTLNKF